MKMAIHISQYLWIHLIYIQGIPFRDLAGHSNDMGGSRMFSFELLRRTIMFRYQKGPEVEQTISVQLIAI
jgi:hypothetical protein